MAYIKFLGGAQTVTGSKFLVDAGRTRFMIDCGMFQGAKKLRLLNWEPCPVKPSIVDHVILTHAHIDHLGLLPRFVREGFKGPIWCTKATQELAEIALIDSAHLQEEDARWANKKGFSKHSPALPLYTQEDAANALRLIRAVEYGSDFELAEDVRAQFQDAGHILGSGIVEAEFLVKKKKVRIVFSGDLGRYDARILRDPAPIEETDYLVVESTYGNRLHPEQSVGEQLASVINETARRGGMLVIPAFAIGRTQTLLYIIRELKESDSIPNLPVYLDSPMAVDVTKLFCEHIEVFDVKARRYFESTGQCPVLCPNLHFVRETEESMNLNSKTFPAIIISASGMATGGRILHHLKHRLPDPKNTVLFIGFQAYGTRGQLLKDGAREIKIHGRQVPVRAQIRTIESLSAHADSSEILQWLRTFKSPPEQTFIVHGEPEGSEGLAAAIKKQLGWRTHIPEYLEAADLR